MEKEENMEMKKGGIINFFDGATINNMVINGNMTKSGTEHFCSQTSTKSSMICLASSVVGMAVFLERDVSQLV